MVVVCDRRSRCFYTTLPHYHAFISYCVENNNNYDLYIKKSKKRGSVVVDLANIKNRTFLAILVCTIQQPIGPVFRWPTYWRTLPALPTAMVVKARAGLRPAFDGPALRAGPGSLRTPAGSIRREAAWTGMGPHYPGVPTRTLAHHASRGRSCLAFRPGHAFRVAWGVVVHFLRRGAVVRIAKIHPAGLGPLFIFGLSSTENRSKKT